MKIGTKPLLIVAILVGLHWVLYTLMIMLSGGSPYEMGRVVGKLFLAGIVLTALLSVSRYGWGTSLVVMAMMLFNEASTIAGVMSDGAGGAANVGPLLLYTLINAPLLAGFVILMLPDSREPFRARRRDAGDGAEVASGEAEQ